MNERFHRIGGTVSYASDSLHHTNLWPLPIIRRKKSWSSPVRNSGRNSGLPSEGRMLRRNSTFPVRPLRQSITKPVGYVARSYSLLFTTHCGGSTSKCGLTGPSTPATLYSFKVVKRVSSQVRVGNSSSSMNATRSPVAFSMALLRASAIFCRDSTQYTTPVFLSDRAANSKTTVSAERDESLSTTTTE